MSFFRMSSLEFVAFTSVFGYVVPAFSCDARASSVDDLANLFRVIWDLIAKRLPHCGSYHRVLVMEISEVMDAMVCD